MSKQTLSFQAEVAQLLHLVTHSLYSNKEIFLRELISNASDACDKLRFEAINDSALYETDPDLKVRVTLDKGAKTLTITDNGIGLSQQEAIDNLGTIAKSGTKDFVSKLSGDQKADSQLIGQFGVGFYSGFIVADKITVESRRAGLPAEQGVRWVSDGGASGGGAFEVETITREARGTSVILHLREDAQDYTHAWKVKGIINKYSDHISLPIQMEKEEWKDGELINPSDENGGRQPGAPNSTTTFTNRSATTSRRRWPTPTTGSKAAPSTPSCSTSPAKRPWTCGTATKKAASSSTSSACSSWTTPRRCCQPTCALSKAWSIRPICP